MIDATVTLDDVILVDAAILSRMNWLRLAGVAAAAVMAGALWTTPPFSGLRTATPAPDARGNIDENPFGTLDGVVEAFNRAPDQRGVAPLAFWEPAPREQAPQEHVAEQLTAQPAPAAPAEPAPRVVAEIPAKPAQRADEAIPLPPANPFRPRTLQRPAGEVTIARAPRRTSAASRVAAAATPQPDTRNFFQRLFGAPAQTPSQPANPALAYARPDEGVRGLPNYSASPSAPDLGSRTAVYDIEARVVHMPNGARLEAHSGLGPRLDDVSFVHEKNRGATPPDVYDLTLRESLFHGVQALRLTPIDGRNKFGRNGLLAHSYMLGPNGDSNGCVSFKDYPEFLNAFRRGEVKRLVVVTRSGGQSLASLRSRT